MIRQLFGGVCLGIVLALVATSCLAVVLDLERVPEIELTPVPVPVESGAAR